MVVNMRSVFKFLLSSSIFLPLSWTPAQAQESCYLKNQSEITIAAVGDIIFHNRLKRSVGNQNFKAIWADVIPLLKSAQIDVLYGNYEGAVSYNDNDPAHVQKVFKNHPKTVADLKDSGFDIMSTANNHCWDAGNEGISNTLREFRRNGLASAGTRLANENPNSADTWSSILNVRGRRIAFLACTDPTNGYKDSRHLVLHCGSSQMTSFISTLARKADAVIVTPHWGQEGDRHLSAAQVKKATAWINAGAVAVIGNHSHLPGEARVIPVMRQGRVEREALLVSSLGNFVSNQPPGIVGKGSRPDFGVLLYFGLSFGPNGASLSDYKFTPSVFDWPHVRVKLQGYNVNSKEAVSYVSRYMGASHLLSASRTNRLDSALSCQ